MDDNMIWALCFLGLLLVTAVALFWLILRDGSKLGTRITALEQEVELYAVVKERVTELERDRDVRNLRAVVAQSAYRDGERLI